MGRNPRRSPGPRKSQKPGLRQTDGARLLRHPLFVAGVGAGALAVAFWFLAVRSNRDVASKTESAGRVPSVPGSTTAAASPVPALTGFVGAEACAGCHQKEYDLWKNSTHGQAGGAPGEVKIIAKFDGKPLQFKDAVVTPIVSATGEYLFVIEQAGVPKMEIKVHAAVGGGHMHGGGTQSFFQEFPDGTMRFLPFDFIRDENLWFVQLRQDRTWVPVSDKISLQSDLANWPPHRVLGTLTEFSNCQNCHGSQISVRYDEDRRQYQTHYQTLRINCESCHGPGKRHLDIVSRPGFENRADIGMNPLATLAKDQSLLVCFQCHAKKDALREDSYLPGEKLEDYFSLKLALLGDSPFLVDGRVRSFDYQSNHQFSDCYLNGSMTCVDCHDPHSLAYRDVFGKPLAGKFDNGQCTGCHASKALSPEKHSHHKPDSPGNLCTSCHMPFLQHQGVGAHLVFARSDHTIPIPRPEFDHRLGIENACQKCHRDRDVAWQEAQLKEWYGVIKPHAPMIANLLKAGESADMKNASELLLAPEAKHPMGQMAGLAAYVQRFLRPSMTTADLAPIERLKALARSDDIDLKSVALMALHLGFDQRPDVRRFLDERRKELGGASDPIRLRWGIALDNVGTAYAASGDLPNAIICFGKSIEIKPDNFVTMSHLALAHLKSGDFDKAIVWLKNAIRLKPGKAVLHFQLAQTYAQNQQIPKAIVALEEGLRFAPEDLMARRMLQQLRALAVP